MINHVREDRLYAKLLRQFVANKHSFLRAYCQYSETLFEKEVERDRELSEMHGGIELHPDDPDYDPESPVAFFSQGCGVPQEPAPQQFHHCLFILGVAI